MKDLKNKWQKLNHRNLLNFSKLLVTFSSVLLFIAWLMFTNHNFYPKVNESFTSKVMNIPIEIMIWPITLITLFIFILPIWVTGNQRLLFSFLLLSLILLLLNVLFLFQLNVNSYWIFWLVTDLINFFVIIFALLVVVQKNKNII